MKALALIVLSLLSVPAMAAVTIESSGLLATIVYLVPEPFNRVIRVVLGLAALIIVINLLLGMIGAPLFRVS